MRKIMKTIRIKPPKSLVGRLLQAGACILFLTLIGGCMGSYGSYNRDSEVFEVFKNDQVPLDYRYYYYHSGSHLIAMIGVEKKYDAGSTMWREIEPNTEKFKDLINGIWQDYGYSRFAARIIDPSGRQVGIMYTSIREVAIKFTDDNRIVVMPHTPFLWGPGAELNGKYYGSVDTNALPSDRHRASKH
jgi:hypothetical protein